MFKGNKYLNRSGFTLIEIIVVLGIVFLIATSSTVLLFSVQSNNAREVIASEIVTVLRSAQSRSMSGESQSEFGVQFFPNKYVEFEGDTYVEEGIGNTEHLLPVGTSLSDIDFGGATAVCFNRITGEASNSGSVDINVTGRGGVKRILVNRLGTVNVQIIE